MFDWIPEGIIGIGIWLVSGVYIVASWAFEVFLILASGRLIDNSSYDLIIQNFYVVLGIIMLFIISFSLLKGMVSAEESKKSGTTIRKMVVNLIVASIVIALLPLIFSFAFDFQDAFITNNNTLGKFFSYGNVGSDDSPISEDNIQRVYSGAFKIVNGVYTAFFNVNVESDTCQKAIEAEKANNPNMLAIDELDVCQRTVEGEKENFKDTMEYVEANGNFYPYGDFNKKAYDGEIDFNFLLSLLAGLLLLYVGISYCFDMGLRLVKLVFYQLVGPIPILLSVIPEGKMSGALKQWVKVTLTCYLEVFVRIFAFYFCLFLCREMLKPEFLTSQIYDYNILLALLTQAFILMGIVMFMRQAPKLFSDITGIDSGNMKLGLKQKLADGGFFTAGALVGGGVTAGVRNLTNAFSNRWEKGASLKKNLLNVAKGSHNIIRSTVAGAASGAVRSGKAGWGAKGFGDMKNSATSGAKAAVSARETRAAYKASHGGKMFTIQEYTNADGKTKHRLSGSIGGHIPDIGTSIGEWAGIGAVSSSTASWFSSGADAFSSAHSTSESPFKGKPAHNKLKEESVNADQSYKLIKDELNHLESINEPLSLEQQERLKELKRIKSYAEEAKLKLKNHELEEMDKKLSVEMSAINDLINAKMKYYDLSSQIFNKKIDIKGEEKMIYEILKDKSGNDWSTSAEVQKLVTKIQNNEIVKTEDLTQINMNSFSDFLDQAGITAKNLAAEKRVQVAHEKALKDEKNPEKK